MPKRRPQRIGLKTLKALKPEARPYEVRDSELRGFILRVQPSGVMSYVVQYGRGKRFTIGRTTALTPAQARDLAKEILADVVRGIDPNEKKRQRKEAEARARAASSLGAFLERDYGPWAESHLKRGAAETARIRSRFADLLDLKLEEVNSWLVDKWRAQRLRQGISPKTVNRDIAALRAALSKAVEWGRLETHPLTRFKPKKVDQKARVRYLSEAEEARLRQALRDREARIRRERATANAWRRARCRPEKPDLADLPFADHLAPMVLLSINTGLRRGELFNLTWADVDLERAMLTVVGYSSKTGTTRHVPLNTEAVTVLRRWKHQTGGGDGLVFPGRGGSRLTDVKKGWRRLLELAGIEGFRWHDLRHHFASRLVMAGVDLNTVRELLGHSDIKMTLRYAHLAPEHKAAAVAMLVRDK